MKLNQIACYENPGNYVYCLVRDLSAHGPLTFVCGLRIHLQKDLSITLYNEIGCWLNYVFFFFGFLRRILNEK